MIGLNRPALPAGMPRPCPVPTIAWMMVILLSALPCRAGQLPYRAGQFPVVRVVDGDTIVIDYHGKKERIRLLNVDTPESVHPDPGRNTPLGKKAAAYTRTRLSGKRVDLLFDGRQRGKYGRLLAYVILDRKNFNLELVQNGWSRYYTKYGTSQRFHNQFKAAQDQARQAGIGVWHQAGIHGLAPALVPKAAPGNAPKSPPQIVAGLSPFMGNTKSKKFHRTGCRHFFCRNCTRPFASREAAVEAGYLPCALCRP